MRTVLLLTILLPLHAPSEPVTATTRMTDVARVALAQVAADKQPVSGGLELAWSVPGRWGGIVADERAGSAFVSTSAAMFEIDSAGRTVREIPSRPGARLRSARFVSGRALLSFGVWSPQLNVYDEKGALLWAYPPAAPSSGIDDVAAVDLDGDGNDEVIIGFNGGTGVHVLNSKGTAVWTSTAIGNVWHVAGGDLRGNGKAQVVTTSGLGQIHIFADDGASRRDIAPGFYADVVRVGKMSERDATATMVAVGRASAGGNTLSLAAFAPDGTKKWGANLVSSSDAFVNAATLSTTRPWVAVSLKSGQVFVLDATNGSVVASADGQGSAELAWLQEKNGGAPLLIVSSPTGVRAFRVRSGR